MYVQERVPFYRDMWAEAARALGLEFVALSGDFWEIRDTNRTIARLHNYVVSIDDPVTLDLAGDKPLVYRLFADAGLQVPRNATVTKDDLDRLVRFVADSPGPVVVKPARNTASGLGITTNVRGGWQALRAAALAFMYCDEAVVEAHVPGESYRLLYLDGHFLCASRRRGLRVVGNGESSVAGLLDLAARSDARLSRWRTDGDIELTVSGQRLTRDYVPPAGTEILVRSADPGVQGNTEIRTVYTEDVTSLICEELVAAGRRASEILGSRFCGVDMITTDPGVSLAASGGVIGEINTTPGLHHHYGLPGAQNTEPFAVAVVRFLQERASRETA